MPRILHVIMPRSPRAGYSRGGREAPGSADEAAALACAAAVRTGGSRHHVLLVGSTIDAAWAASLGLHARERLNIPLNMARLVGPSLRTYIAQRGPFAGIVCWSPAVRSRAARWVGPASRLARVVDCERGLLFDSWGAGPGTPLALHAGEPIACDRERWRRALRLPDGAVLVGLLGDAPGAAPHLAYLLSITNPGGIAAIGIMHRRASGCVRALRHLDQTGAPVLRLAPGPSGRWIGACDFAVSASGEGPASFADGVLARHALALGVPVIAPAQHPISRLLTGGLAPALAASSRRVELARAMFDVATTPGVLARCRDAARAAVMGPTIADQVLRSLELAAVPA